MTHLHRGLLAVAVALLFVPSAPASVILLNFNNPSGSFPQTWTLDNGVSVRVSGAGWESRYTGDDHVVGPGNGSVPHTLGTTDGGVFHPGFDSFLVNRGSDRITMIFSEPVFSVSFDYQIFPNAEVPDGTRVDPSRYPDFTFAADDQVIFRTLGVLPGTNGTFAHSPFSGPSQNELAPQFLGASGLITFDNGVTKLEFIDWPVLVGIDNLQLGFQPGGAAVIPEPASAVALSLAVASGLALGLRRRKSRGPSSFHVS